MEIDVYRLLHETQALVLFLVLGFGYMLGNIPLVGVRLGPTAGVLVAGLIFGHFGLTVSPTTMEIGFIIFIYSVGLQAGPRFFSVFFEDGLKYAALAAIIALTAFGLAQGLSSLMDFKPGLAAGMLSGALTSSPTLAAAQDAVKSGLAGVSGAAADAILRDITVGYAITYLFGLIGLMAFIKLMPSLVGLNLVEEAQKLAAERHMPENDEIGEDEDTEPPRIRVFEVNNPETFGKPLEELTFCRDAGCVVQQVKRQGALLSPDASTRLEQGDRVSIAGPLEELEGLSEHLGEGVFDRDLLQTPLNTAVVIVNSADAAGKTLGELHILARFGCNITRIVRAQIDLPVGPHARLEKGDVLTVAGLENRLQEFIKSVGYVERGVVQTDLLTFALGIAGGLLLGKMTFKFGTLSLGLGTAGGLLIAGILVGFLRSLHPTFGRVPPAARWVFMELGLMFFMAGVGVKAGAGIVEALVSVGLPMFLCGVAVTLGPVLVGFAAGRYIFRINPVLLLGAITGSMTSTPSLNIVTQSAKSPLPSLGYAGTYTFANVFLTLGGALMMML